MTTPTTVDTLMRVAMMVTMVALTTARPMTAPMLITPAGTDDDVLASAMQVFEVVRHACAADAREWRAWYDLTRIVTTPASTRARVFE
eukprot:1652319-Pyramimonas_sp.AAC.1